MFVEGGRRGDDPKGIELLGIPAGNFYSPDCFLNRGIPLDYVCFGINKRPICIAKQHAPELVVLFHA